MFSTSWRCNPPPDSNCHLRCQPLAVKQLMTGVTYALQTADGLEAACPPLMCFAVSIFDLSKNDKAPHDVDCSHQRKPTAHVPLVPIQIRNPA